MTVQGISSSRPPEREILPTFFCKTLEKVENLWRSIVHKSCTFLYFNLGWRCIALSAGTWLTEPAAAFEAAALYPLAWLSRPFRCCGVNPTSLTAEQRGKKPLLLLHGNYANPATFLPLIRSLQRAHLGPIFTVSLFNDEITEADHAIVEEKIREIQALYNSYGVPDTKIDIVGHSRGGKLGFETLQRHQEVIDVLVRIGWISTPEDLASLSHEQKTKLYEITAKKDLILPDPSIHPFHTHRYIAESGHLGAIYDNFVHERIVTWLNHFPH